MIQSLACDFYIWQNTNYLILLIGWQLRQDQQPSTGEQDAAPGTSGVNQVKELTDASTVQMPHTKEMRKDAVEDSSILCKEEDDKEIERECEKGKTDIDIIKDLKIELKWVDSFSLLVFLHMLLKVF